MTDPLEPTTRTLLWNDSVEVLCFGAATGDWRMRGKTAEENEAFNPGIVERLRGLARRYNAGRIYMPAPYQFNAELAEPEEFVVRWEDDFIRRGVAAEGTVLQKVGEAMGIASADCPTIIARNAKSLLVAAGHAGRDSLYDKEAVHAGAPYRPHESVVFSIMEKLMQGRACPQDIQVYMACGIRGKSFTHPTSLPHPERAANERTVTHLRARWGASVASDDGLGTVSLQELARLQFKSRGVYGEQFAEDGVDTFDERWHSHHRDADGTRNFVLVIRRK